jgi:hypothetical protein
VETAKIAVDSCYVLRQFLTPLPSIDFREIRGLVGNGIFRVFPTQYFNILVLPNNEDKYYYLHFSVTRKMRKFLKFKVSRLLEMAFLEPLLPNISIFSIA